MQAFLLDVLTGRTWRREGQTFWTREAAVAEGKRLIHRVQRYTLRPDEAANIVLYRLRNMEDTTNPITTTPLQPVNVRLPEAARMLAICKTNLRGLVSRREVPCFLSARQCAERYGVPTRHWHNMVDTGKAPSQVQITSCITVVSAVHIHPNSIMFNHICSYSIRHVA